MKESSDRAARTSFKTKKICLNLPPSPIVEKKVQFSKAKQ